MAFCRFTRPGIPKFGQFHPPSLMKLLGFPGSPHAWPAAAAEPAPMAPRHTQHWDHRWWWGPARRNLGKAVGNDIKGTSWKSHLKIRINFSGFFLVVCQFREIHLQFDPLLKWNGPKSLKNSKGTCGMVQNSIKDIIRIDNDRHIFA